MKLPLPRKTKVAIGTVYYMLHRYWRWYFSSIRFSQKRQSKPLNFLVFEHSSPILRKLKEVDMQLQHNKKQNLLLAINNLSGITIRPGETFSFWKLVGKPTKRKGYLMGMVLDKGRFKAETGGGLCQLTNLIYWISLHTPLIVTERYRHGYDVFPDANRTQPFGSGATCYYNYLDLQVKNETAGTFQFMFEIKNDFLVGRCYSSIPVSVAYEIIEKDHRICHESIGVYTRHNKLFRLIKDRLSGQVLDTEFVTENHAIMMYHPLLKNSD